MSGPLAIAGVTALLRNLLDNGVVDDTLVSTVGTVRVSALAPDLIALAGDAGSQLNLFLFQVTPNPGWRNAGLPSRDSRGDRVANPPLALDLHYLLTAYAGRELHAEILLGYAMQVLHETPGLSREAIRRGLSVPDLVTSPDLLTPDLRAIAASELDEQIESIRITPRVTGTEEMSKLWTALQSKYRPSTMFEVSVVLIESKRPTRRALPVARRKLYVTPFRSPRIERVLSQESAAAEPVVGAPVLAGHRLVLQGSQLQGERTLVRIGATTVLPQTADLRDSEIRVTLPPELRAGLLSAQVIHEHLMGEPPVPHAGTASNLASFVLRPELVQVELLDSPPALRLSLNPPFALDQRAVVFLNERITGPTAVPRAYSFVVPAQPPASPPELTELVVPIDDVAPGTYLVRLQVDGAESPLVVDAQGQYAGPQVVVS